MIEEISYAYHCYYNIDGVHRNEHKHDRFVILGYRCRIYQEQERDYDKYIINQTDKKYEISLAGTEEETSKIHSYGKKGVGNNLPVEHSTRIVYTLKKDFSDEG